MHEHDYRARGGACVVPANPLERFCDLYTALLADRPWWQGGWSMLRYCALALTTLPGEVREVAARLDAVSEELRTSVPWYKRSSVGTMLAALLLRHGDNVHDFLAEVERASDLFREHWRFSGSTYEALAIQVLRHESGDGHVQASQVARLAAIFEVMKKDHPLLTNRADWPSCALLAGSSATPSAIRQRLEALYQATHARGFQRGDALQLASQILCFHQDAPDLLSARFATLYAQFKDSGLWMGSQDYDEIALLCFAPQSPAEVLGTVQRHRAMIAALQPAPDKQCSFSLACGTALLELVRDSARIAQLGEAQLLIHIRMVLAAQQAAAAAAASTT